MKKFKLLGILILAVTIMPLDVMADETFNQMPLMNEDSLVQEDVISEENETLPVEEESSETSEEVVEEQAPVEEEVQEQKTIQTQDTPQVQSTQNGLSYSVFKDGLGWVDTVGTTTDTTKKIYAIKFDEQYINKFTYRAHISNVGWTSFVNPGQILGNAEKKNDIQAIEIKLLDNTFSIAYRAFVPNYGWLDYQTGSGVVGTESMGLPITSFEILQTSEITKGKYPSISYPSLSGEAHVQNVGWKKNEGNIYGTQSRGLRVEGLKLNIDNKQISGNIEYSAQVQNIGWQQPVTNGQMIGTNSRGLRLEAFRLKLTGDLSRYFDIYYRTHVEYMGWLPWAVNGSDAGTQGYGLRMEAVEIRLEPKNSNNIASSKMACYKSATFDASAHVENQGWSKMKDLTLGTTGRGRRVEGIKLNISGTTVGGDIEYQSMVQNKGWMSWVKNGELSGTQSQGLRIESFKIKLSGEMAQYYNVYYRAHVQNFGWLGWTANGREAGSEGYGYKLEAIQIDILPKAYAKYQISNNAYKKYQKPSKIQYVPTYYAQGDRRWGSRYYGMGNMAATGCVPTSIASAVSGVLGRQVLPTEIADYLYHNTSEFNRINIGASGLAFKLGVERYGIPTRGLTSGRELNHALSRGQIVLAMVGSNSPFISGGTHAIVLFGWDPTGKTNVFDPNDSRKNGIYRTEDIMRWQSGDPYDWRGGYVFYSVGFNSWD